MIGARWSASFTASDYGVSANQARVFQAALDGRADWTTRLTDGAFLTCLLMLGVAWAIPAIRKREKVRDEIGRLGFAIWLTLSGVAILGRSWAVHEVAMTSLRNSSDIEARWLEATARDAVTSLVFTAIAGSFILALAVAPYAKWAVLQIRRVHVREQQKTLEAYLKKEHGR